ncbi:hypothetical protein BHM03_00051999 [Ensete ventricosum]|nr:hypothetical protein BHM03_00051999 [Ensete ventricosum]
MHPKVQDTRRYCRFHHDYGHDTEECHDLKNQIKDLIRQGHLSHYVREPCQASEGCYSRNPSPRPRGPIEKQINVIVGRPTSGGDNSSAQKAYAEEAMEKRSRS